MDPQPCGRPPAMTWALVQAILAGEIDAPLPEDVYGPGFPVEEPTEHMPGTEGKVEVLVERARRFQQLFDPRDAPGRKELS